MAVNFGKYRKHQGLLTLVLYNLIVCINCNGLSIENTKTSFDYYYQRGLSDRVLIFTPNIYWCGRRESNPHGGNPLDPKSSASASSATSANINGEPCRIRTCDTLIKSQVLYQLS